MKIALLKFLAFTLLVLLPFAPVYSQKKKRGKEPSETQAPEKKENGKNGVKPYGEVITSKAITDDGLFKVHTVEGKYYFEIQDSLLNTREFLLSSKISGFVENLDFGGSGMAPKPEYVVRWDKNGKKIYLRAVSYSNVANPDTPIYQSVKHNNFEPVIFGFDIQTVSPDSTSYVIEISDFLTTDVDFIGPLSNQQRTDFGIRSLDKSRSFVSSMKSFPLNTEVRHVLTYSGTKLPDNQATGTLSVEMNQSFVLLPKTPMMPRLQDPRVGFFALDVKDYSSPEQRTATKAYITRWKLEPKDWNAWKRGELVEPVKPIVWYIDPATPKEYVPYLKQGVEDWQVAFEAIGFKNAVVAKEPPSKEEDPDWSPEDIRYSVIRYIATTIINAQGPHTHDPRSGEIIESDILWYHNVLTWLRTLYTLQTGAINPNVRKPELSPEDIGTMIRYVCAHEVGHALGFPHNMGASSAYPVDSLRSPSFTKKWGITPSVMDYARANYVAQPGDGDVHLLNNKIGPYDFHAVKWGYKPIPEAKSPEQELATLNNWILEKAGDVKFRYGRQTVGSHIDPSAQTEDLGDDAAKAGTYGMENLKRIMPNLIKWAKEDGKDYQTLQEMYSEGIRNWNIYIGHAAQYVGGVYEEFKNWDQQGYIHNVVPKAKQAACVKFINDYCFVKPDFMLDEDILRRLESAGAVERIRTLQTNQLNKLLDPGRMARLIEAEAFLGDKTYTLSQLLTDLRTGLWAELYKGSATNIYRRNLQRGFIERMEHLMTEQQQPVPPEDRSILGFTPINVAQSDIRPMVRAELARLNNDIKINKNKASDPSTRAHYDDAMVRIDDILNPSK